LFIVAKTVNLKERNMDELNLGEKKEFDIVEIKEWKDKNSGMTVIEQIPFEGWNQDKILIKKTISRYGKAHIQTHMGPIGFQFVFPEGYTLLECFENFETHAQAALDAMEKESRNQIVIPQGVNVNNLKA